MNFLMSNARVLIDQVRKGVFAAHLFDPSAMPSELLSHISPSEYAESIQRLNTAAKNHPKLALGIYYLAKLTSVASLISFIYFCWAWRSNYDSYDSDSYYGDSNRVIMIYSAYTFWVSLVIRVIAGLHLSTRRRQRLARAVAAEHGIYMNRFPQSSWRIAHNHHRIATLEIEKHCPIMPTSQPQQVHFMPQQSQQPQQQSQPAMVHQMPSAPDMAVHYSINDSRRYPSINQPLLPVYHQV